MCHKMGLVQSPASPAPSICCRLCDRFEELAGTRDGGGVRGGAAGQDGPRAGQRLLLLLRAQTIVFVGTNFEVPSSGDQHGRFAVRGKAWYWKRYRNKGMCMCMCSVWSQKNPLRLSVAFFCPHGWASTRAQLTLLCLFPCKFGSFEEWTSIWSGCFVCFLDPLF